jgi:hypothetical protein
MNLAEQSFGRLANVDDGAANGAPKRATRLERQAITLALLLPGSVWAGEAWHPIGWLVAAVLAGALVVLTVLIGAHRRATPLVESGNHISE